MLKGNEISIPAKELTLMLEAGYVYRYAGKFREAREIFQGVRALLPKADAAEIALAGVALDEKKLDEAEAHCRRALEVNPGSAAAYAQLGEVLLLQNDGAGAQKSLKKSIELSPSGPSAALAKAIMQAAAMLARKS
jgi:tetratricopeptide (TPR) repeat protein